MENVISQLKKFFDEKHISQKEVADTIGIKPQYVNAIFSGRWAISCLTAARWTRQTGRCWTCCAARLTLARLDGGDAWNCASRLLAILDLTDLTGWWGFFVFLNLFFPKFFFCFPRARA